MAVYIKVFNICAKMLMVAAAFMLLPLVVVPFYGEFSSAIKFFLPSLAVAALGFPIIRITKGKENIEIGRKVSAVAVVLSWVCVVFACALPFVMHGYSFTHAVFESTSGLTATGVTVTDVEAVPKALLLWRSITMFLGGLGVVFVMLIILPVNSSAMLYGAEGHTDRLYPNIRRTVKAIFLIYVGYITLGVVLYCICGMGLFDAVNHSICALASGGFSTRANSIGSFNSVAIEAVTVFIMLLSAINFGVHLAFLTKNFKRAASVTEFRALPFILIVIVLMMLAGGMSAAYGLGYNFRTAIFETVSAVTTTGYTIRPEANFSALELLAVVFIMLVGASSGSTSGGFKTIRLVILFKSIWWSIRKNFESENDVNEYFITGLDGKIYCTDEVINQNNTIIALFVLMLAFAALVFSACGFSSHQALLHSASLISNTGLGFVELNTTAGLLWFQSALMFLGRLEFSIVILALCKIGKDIFIRD